MGQVYRLTLVSGVVAAIAASIACGGGDGGRGASPTAAAVSTASPAVTSTVAATVASTAQTPTTAAVAPSATSAAQATSAPAVQPTVAPPPPTAPPPSAKQSLTIVAKDVKFSPSSLTARAGAVLNLTLDNQDAGVPHDIVLYDASGAIVGATEPVNGPVQQTVTVMLDSPRYTFKCSVHPQTMNGSLLAQ